MPLDPLTIYFGVATVVAIVSVWVAPYTSAKGSLTLAVLGGLLWPIFFGAMVYYALRLPSLPDLCRWCYLCSAKLATCRASGNANGIACRGCFERRGF